MLDAQDPPKTPEELTNTTLEGILINHNFTWMPPNREDCPCMECQGFIDREEALERESIWPHDEDYTIGLTDSGAGTCPCGKPIEQFRDYSPSKKATIVSAVRHVLVSFYTVTKVSSLITTSLPGPYTFKSVVKVRVHRWCVLETREDLDMETQARNILLLEGLPDKGKRLLGRYFEEQPEQSNTNAQGTGSQC